MCIIYIENLILLCLNTVKHTNLLTIEIILSKIMPEITEPTDLLNYYI